VEHHLGAPLARRERVLGLCRLEGKAGGFWGDPTAPSRPARCTASPSSVTPPCRQREIHSQLHRALQRAPAYTPCAIGLQPCMGANLSRCYPVHSRFPRFLGQLDMRRAQESVKGWPPLSGAPRAGQMPQRLRARYGRLGRVGMTIGGEPACGARNDRAAALYSVGPMTLTMMQPCASAAKLRGGGPILVNGIEAMVDTGPRHLEPSSATRRKSCEHGGACQVYVRRSPFTVQVGGRRPQRRWMPPMS
jgi:hypothetical protein